MGNRDVGSDYIYSMRKDPKERVLGMQEKQRIK